MEAAIQKLLLIQDRDSRIAKLRKQIETVPREKAAIEQQMSGATALLEEARATIQEAEKRIKAVEIEIGSVTQRKLDLLGKSHQIKKNDEYKAMLHEVELFDQKVSELETKQLEHMEMLDKAKQGREAAQKEVDAIKSRLQGTIQDLEVRAQNCEAEIAKVEAGREELAADVPVDLMRLYSRLISKGADSFRAGLAPLVGENCQNCNLKVVPQVRHKVLKNVTVCCENCGVILYNPE